jgi:tRNA wybutosine-synthesizing protein 1
MIPEKLKRDLEHQQYRVVGKHSAVKLCSWTKASLRDEGFCYKEKFYGIKSHRCLQMTPNITCDQNCMFCWRIIEKTKVMLDKDVDEPKDIIQGCIEQQRLLLTGFKGFGGTNLRKFREAQNPTNAAISLLGEPLLYPKLSSLLEEFHKMKITTFLVTNSQHPEILERITEPRQLYISVDAPERETYLKLDRPSNQDYWERLQRSLDVMNNFSCRKVLRLTMVKGFNMKNPEGYAKLIKRANPNFVELKGYVHVGESQKRLPREAMPLHPDVKAFSKKVSELSGYPYKDEEKSSRVVLLGK